MGLDITAYERVELAEKITRAALQSVDWNHPKYDDEEFRWLGVAYEEHRDRFDGLDEGFYRTSGESHRFRAGSYTGYNCWREQLCEMVCGRKPQAVWNGEVQPVAFGELIDFSDCEGDIGPKTSAKLAADFEKYAGQAEEWARRLGGEDGRWFIDRYRDWAKAFKLAANGGVVEFH